MGRFQNRFYGYRTPIVYEIFEHKALFQNIPWAMVVRIQYRQNDDEIINELLLSAVDVVYTDVMSQKLIDAALDMGIIIFHTEQLPGFRETHEFFKDLYTAGGYKGSPIREWLLSALDLAGGIVGSIMAVILTVILTPIIKLDSKGPVLFRQERIGLDGRRFMCMKFRTMSNDAERRKDAMAKESNIMDGQMFKVENDDRITKVGRFLRKTSLDEFPQFWNVLAGDMSIVGTRPPTTDEIHKYETQHKQRLIRKPGITGMWQTSGRNKITSFAQVVALDMEYITNRTLRNYIKILFRTVSSVKSMEGK